MDKNISFTLKVWRQRGPKEKGHFQTIPVNHPCKRHARRYFIPRNVGYRE